MCKHISCQKIAHLCETRNLGFWLWNEWSKKRLTTILINILRSFYDQGLCFCLNIRCIQVGNATTEIPMQGILSQSSWLLLLIQRVQTRFLLLCPEGVCQVPISDIQWIFKQKKRPWSEKPLRLLMSMEVAFFGSVILWSQPRILVSHKYAIFQ